MNLILGPSYWGFAKSDASSTWFPRQNGHCGEARVETAGGSGHPQTEPLQIASGQTASWWHGIWPWWSVAGGRWLEKTWGCQSTYLTLNIVVYNWRLLCNLATPSQMWIWAPWNLWAPEPNGFDVQDVKWFSCNLLRCFRKSRAISYLLHISHTNGRLQGVACGNWRLTM